MDKSTLGYIQQLHVNSSLTKFMETEPGLEIKLGRYAKLLLSDGVQLTKSEIEHTQLIASDTLSHQNEYFDFEIDNITPFGRSVSFVLPLTSNIPKYAVYRKYSEANGWQDFVEDANNIVASALAVNDVCPPLSSTLYATGLKEGDNCLKNYYSRWRRE